MDAFPFLRRPIYAPMTHDIELYTARQLLPISS